MSLPQNHNQTWTKDQIKQLRQLAKGNTPTRIIALKMARTESSIQSAAAKFGISLKPTNQSPYNRRK